MKIFKFALLGFCFLSVQSMAQEAPTKRKIDPRFESLSDAYGTLLNVEETLKAVEKQHPDLKERISKVRNDLMASAVGKGFGGVVKTLKEITGDEFAEYDKAYREQVREHGAAQEITKEVAGIALENIEKIKKGNLKTEVLRTVIARNPEYQKSPLKEYQDGWVAGYSSKMDQVERKVHYLLRYPGSWRPKVPQAKHHIFVADNLDGFGNVRLSLTVIDAPDPKYAKMDPLELAKDLTPPAGKVLESAKSKVAGLPAGRIVYDLKAEGSDLALRLITHSVHAKGKFVIITAAIDPREGKDPAKEVERISPLIGEIAAKLEIE